MLSQNVLSCTASDQRWGSLSIQAGVWTNRSWNSWQAFVATAWCNDSSGSFAWRCCRIAVGWCWDAWTSLWKWFYWRIVGYISCVLHVSVIVNPSRREVIEVRIDFIFRSVIVEDLLDFSQDLSVVSRFTGRFKKLLGERRLHVCLVRRCVNRWRCSGRRTLTSSCVKLLRWSCWRVSCQRSCSRRRFESLWRNCRSLFHLVCRRYRRPSVPCVFFQRRSISLLLWLTNRSVSGNSPQRFFFVARYVATVIHALASCQHWWFRDSRLRCFLRSNNWIVLVENFRESSFPQTSRRGDVNTDFIVVHHDSRFGEFRFDFFNWIDNFIGNRRFRFRVAQRCLIARWCYHLRWVSIETPCGDEKIFSKAARRALEFTNLPFVSASSFETWLWREILFALFDWMRPKDRYPSSLISLPLSLMFSYLFAPSLQAVPISVFTSVIVRGSSCARGIWTVEMCAAGISNELCFFLMSINRLGLGDIERRDRLGDAVKYVFSFVCFVERKSFDYSNRLADLSSPMEIVTHLTRLRRNVANVRFALCRASAAASVACWWRWQITVYLQVSCWSCRISSWKLTCCRRWSNRSAKDIAIN